MYVKQQGYRYPGDIRPPQNYSGNTFRQLPDNEPLSSGEDVSPTPTPEPPHDPEPDTVSALLRKDDCVHPESPAKGIGSEELLILALILLLSDSEMGDKLLIFLVLLFFIK